MPEKTFSPAIATTPAASDNKTISPRGIDQDGGAAALVLGSDIDTPSVW
ncbi:hypothetical protein GCM10011610_60990 [Nocardia rhizosphaerihabitans]|uniref:Uncharacterized protein n=1 Tax=Nocardia rhizosphaerihabitans TaxID=1691570 RepID=A0ABQ2KXN2_9NOCA|nr:hypothetical protein GCM10011610_60990 [Nocardia rhizosphaerihabitans]